MIPRALLVAAAPAVALLAIGPVVDGIARRLMAAPRRSPDEAGMAPALDRLGGEVVRLRSRDGVRLTGRWLAAEAEDGPDPGAPEPIAAAGGAAAAGAAAPEPDPVAASDAASEPGAGWHADPREAVLVLHGWSGSVTPDLLELGPFLRRTAGVLGLDFRGHGGSDEGPTTFGPLEIEDVAGALAWLGERGIRRVALVGSSMGATVAIAAVAVLGDGRLASADIDLDAPADVREPPRPRIVAVVADSVAPDLAAAVGRHLRLPFGRRIAGHAFARMAAVAGGDPRRTQALDVAGLLEDVPLLVIHGARDRSVRRRDVDRLAAAVPGASSLVIEGAGHGDAHRVDPARYEAAVTRLLRDAFLAARA